MVARVEHVEDNLSLLYNMVEYNKRSGKTPRLVVQSDMDVKLHIEVELEGLYIDHHTAVVTSHMFAHQDRNIGPLSWEATMNV